MWRRHRRTVVVGSTHCRALIPGRATRAGTLRYFQARKLAHDPSHLFCGGRLPLHLAPLGFGAARINSATPTHRKAAHLALRAGCNFLDICTLTAPHEPPRRISREEMLGAMLDEMIATKFIRRDEICIATHLDLTSRDPIDTQLDAALTRLRLATADLVFLTNLERCPAATIHAALLHLATHARVAHVGLAFKDRDFAIIARPLLRDKTFRGGAAGAALAAVQFPCDPLTPRFDALDDDDDDDDDDDGAFAGVVRFGIKGLHCAAPRRRRLAPSKHAAAAEIAARPAAFGQTLTQAFNEAMFLERHVSAVVTRAFADADAAADADVCKQLLAGCRWVDVLLHNDQALSASGDFVSVAEEVVIPSVMLFVDAIHQQRERVARVHPAYAVLVANYRASVEKLLEKLAWRADAAAVRWLAAVESALRRGFARAGGVVGGDVAQLPFLQMVFVVLLFAPRVDRVVIGMRRDEYVRDALFFMHSVLPVIAPAPADRDALRRAVALVLRDLPAAVADADAGDDAI